MKKERLKYGLRPVERIELSEKHFPVKAALVFTGIAVAVLALVVTLTRLLAVEPGWREIKSDGSMGIHCGDDFSLRVDLGAQTGSPQAELKLLTRAYTEATATAYRLFSVYSAYEGMNNLRTLNDRPNQPVALDPALIRAMRTVCGAGRYLFLAPVYDVNVSLFHCASDYEALDFDPLRNEDVRAYFDEVCRFASDDASVGLEFPDDSTAVLRVSDAYAAFAAEYGIAAYVDFGWMKNAFIADYLAARLEETGLTHAVIASADGFVRHLDASGEQGALRVYERDASGAIAPGVLRYDTPAALVTLRAFPAVAPDEGRYYVNRGDGAVYAPYADPADGLPRCAVESLTGLSRNDGCGELLARMLPLYISDAWDGAAAEALASEGVGLAYAPGEGFAVLGEGLRSAADQYSSGAGPFDQTAFSKEHGFRAALFLHN